MYAPLSCQIARITIYGMVYVQFSEEIRKINASTLDIELSLKKNESGKEIDVPVGWALLEIQD